MREYPEWYDQDAGVETCAECKREKDEFNSPFFKVDGDLLCSTCFKEYAFAELSLLDLAELLDAEMV